MEKGMICPLCGGELIWNIDEMACDVCSDGYENDDDAIASFYTCNVCGREYEIIDPTKEVRDNLEYWQDNA